MHRLSYTINENSVLDENGKRIKTYGLSLTIDGYHYDFCDLCTDKERLISLCNRFETEVPEPKTLYEIFDDYIFQK